MKHGRQTGPLVMHSAAAARAGWKQRLRGALPLTHLEVAAADEEVDLLALPPLQHLHRLVDAVQLAVAAPLHRNLARSRAGGQGWVGLPAAAAADYDSSLTCCTVQQQQAAASPRSAAAASRRRAGSGAGASPAARAAAGRPPWLCLSIYTPSSCSERPCCAMASRAVSWKRQGLRWTLRNDVHDCQGQHDARAAQSGPHAPAAC